MDVKRVEELIELMRRSGVTHLALELPDYKISITRGAEPSGESAAGPAEAGVAGERAAPDSPSAAGAPQAQGVTVTSPVVGVFHNGGMIEPRHPVKEGDRVEAGQLVAAIEAMKVPNELRAPVGGVVARLLAEDGAPVAYGQPLLVIAPEEGSEAHEADAVVGLA